ncbi:uncharacterized protein LOC123498255 isoform X3 [Portunus trituberculatus]|uniref:uncharacterized protein LOC123498255 isoform X3 n=1 Tax=Portunus trituberculatus TaxID=210409 RepID=UPI001E1CFDE5|nr:uncharacterized protein LOC123498255 isoform X3 [Portunus trituberculatus]
MKVNQHKVGLLVVLLVSAVFLCYSLLSHELPSMHLKPASSVWRFWNPPRQHHTVISNSTTLGDRKIYYTFSPQRNTTAPATVHRKHQVNRKNLRRLTTLCVGDAQQRNASQQVKPTTCRLLEQRARVVQEVCRRQHVQQAPPGTDRSHDGDEPGNYVEYVSRKHIYLLRRAFTLTCVINKTDNEFEFARRHFFKFLLVRHPFSRLLSAYRDKVEAAQHWSLKQLREHIFTTLAEANLTKRRPNKDSQNSGDDIPTFRDFLEYILINKWTGGGFDSHWAPYWHLCSPCFIQYDAVAKLETAHTDLKYIWHHMRLKEPVPWINRSSQNSTSGSTINHYYQGLSPDLIARVYHHYSLDFKMFQYDILDVVREGGHCHMQDCSDMVPFFS